MKYSKICKEFKNFKERLSSELDSKNAFFTLFSGIHLYFGVDWDTVWDVIKKKIPELEDKLKKLEDSINGDK